jgi:vacuolar-type H+-ATPase subunit H
LVISRIAAAQETSQANESKAREEAARILAEARELGYRQGQAEYDRLVATSTSDAEAILEQARQQAQQLRQKAQCDMDGLIQSAMDFITGQAEVPTRP